MVKDAFYTFLDQIVISATAFLFGLAFIYGSSPAEYGLYTVLISVFYLIASAQNALINTPLMVLSSRLSNEEKVDFEKGLFHLWLVVVSVICLLSAAFSPLIGAASRQFDGRAFALFIFAIALVPLSLRDYFRAREFSLLKPKSAFRRDIMIALLSTGLLGILVLSKQVIVENVLIITAVSTGMIAGLPTLRSFKGGIQRERISSAFNTSWKHSKWSLLGATSSWMQANAYIYIPFILIGAKEVAILAAARLIMTPAVLLSQSWSNYFRPLASSHLSKNDTGEAFNLLVRSSGILLSILFAYTVMIWTGLRFMPANVLPPDYSGIGNYVALWAAVIFFQMIRTNTSSFLQASLEFKSLAFRGLTSALLTAAITVILVTRLEESGAIMAQVAGEIILMLLLMSGIRTALRSAKNVDEQIDGESLVYE